MGAGDNRYIEYYNNFLSYLERDLTTPNARHGYVIERLTRLIKPGETVLDIGCGVGVTTAALHAHGALVTGIDFAPALIARACEAFPHVQFEVRSALEPRESCAWATVIDCMEHIPREDYPALWQALSPHRNVWLSVPDPNYLDSIRADRPHALQIVDNSITYEEMTGLATGVGFALLDFETYGIGQRGIRQYNAYHFSKPA